MNRKLWIIAAIACLVILSAVRFFQVTGSLEGYYRTKLFETLDGGAGYLRFHDGTVELFNFGGQGGDTRDKIGTYRLLSGGKVQVTFNDPRLPSPTIAFPGKLAFTWPAGFALGMPNAERCPREFLPWRLRKLENLEQTLEPRTP
jgi:hypothetical protein